MRFCLGLCAAALAVLMTACAPPNVSNAPRQQIDSQLAAEIDSIPAIDNHAHPTRVVNEGEKDAEFDALPVEMMEPYDTMPLRLRADNAEFTGAWRRLYGTRFEDMRPERIKQAMEAKRRAIQSKGDNYDVWVLDQLKIGVMFANRVAMGRGLPPSRFKWVPYADALMYPFNNESISKHDPDRKAFFGAEQKLLRQYLNEAGISGMPNSLDDYLRFITATLERWKKENAVAVKFELAYLRSFDIGNPGKTDADRIYSIYARAAMPTDAEYKTFEDFAFRHIAAECGRLGLAVHLHSSAGAGRNFDVPGVNPMLLASVMLDPAMRKTNFVLVHGSWPFTREVTALLDKPNVFVDFSYQSYVLYPRALSEVLRGWLEYAPEKVLYATDASPFTDALSWEETAWMSDTTAREALGLALTGMLRDREIGRERALDLARMVLRGNAMKLYGLQ